MLRTEKRLMALSLGIAFAVDTHLGTERETARKNGEDEGQVSN